MKLLDLLFEDQKNKKLLLLVHPDVVFETNNDFAQEYYKQLEWHMTYFDYVIVHLMFSDDAPKHLQWDENKTSLFSNFRKMLESNSNFIKLDKNFSASFNDTLPDYLIENPNTEINLGGGYKNLCVKDTQKQLFSRLGDIIKETGASISCYGPLIITERHKPQIDYSLSWNNEDI